MHQPVYPVVDYDLLQTLEVQHIRKQEGTLGCLLQFRFEILIRLIYLFEAVRHQGEQCQRAQLILPHALPSVPWVIMAVMWWQS